MHHKVWKDGPPHIWPVTGTVNVSSNGNRGTTTGGGGGGNGDDRSRRFAFAMRALGRTPVSMFYQSPALVYKWAENLPDGLVEEMVVGFHDGDFLPGLAAERLTAVKEKLVETGEPQRFELPVNLGGEVRWFDVWIDPDLDEETGAVIGVFSTLIEISEQKRREVQLKSLLREVSHRSRNLLAIVLSLASQTARSSRSLPEFITAFSGRLQAIARAQDLVTDRDWQGALLSDLIARQIALFRGDQAFPVSISGDDSVISPSAALYVGLAIHELSAIAARHSQADGSENGPVDVTIKLEPGPDGSRSLLIEWAEPEPLSLDGLEPLTRAFLENVVPLAVEGSGEIAQGQDSFSYTLRVDGTHLS